jgi:hypothetical protein
MNSSVTFPAPAPELKLPRTSADKWAATLAEERRRLQEDQDALRERETNLREYEERLRAWQTQLDAGRASAIPAAQGLRSSLPGMSYTPAGPTTNVDTALQSAWEKLHRAREILEAEQTHLRDDRIAIREMDASVKRREEAVAAREAQLAEREALINAAMTSVGTTAHPEEDHSMSAVSRITRAPFDLARSVFGGKK